MKKTSAVKAQKPVQAPNAPVKEKSPPVTPTKPRDSFDGVRALGAAFEKFGRAMQDDQTHIRDLVSLGRDCGVVLSFNIVEPMSRVV